MITYCKHIIFIRMRWKCLNNDCGVCSLHIVYSNVYTVRWIAATHYTRMFLYFKCLCAIARAYFVCCAANPTSNNLPRNETGFHAPCYTLCGEAKVCVHIYIVCVDVSPSRCLSFGLLAIVRSIKFCWRWWIKNINTLVERRRWNHLRVFVCVAKNYKVYEWS